MWLISGVIYILTGVVKISKHSLSEVVLDGGDSETLRGCMLDQGHSQALVCVVRVEPTMAIPLSLWVQAGKKVVHMAGYQQENVQGRVSG